MKTQTPAVSFSEFTKAFEWKTDFGPLWNDPAFVMACLVRYLASECHNAKGWTVGKLASVFLYDPNAPAGEEIDAVACLLKLNCGSMIIP